MKRFTIGLTVAALTLSLSALQAPAEGNQIDSLHSFGEAIMWYPTDRVHDVFDIPKLNIGFGLGYDVSAKVTNYLGFSIADVDDSCNWGWNRDGVLPQVWHESKEANGASLLEWDCGTGLDEDSKWEVGASLFAGLLGVGAGLDFDETTDAVLGVVLIDLNADDQGPSLYVGEGDM